MEVITIESKAFSQLLSNIEELTSTIKQQNKFSLNHSTKKDNKSQPVLGEQWLDNEEVCKLLKVTKRTLQNYRDNFILPYTQVGKKILYKASDVQSTLEQNYIHLDTT